jgi:CRISPR-associated endonuclease/helicase Cas3
MPSLEHSGATQQSDELALCSPPWGKLGQGSLLGREQSLAGHCRDVAAIFVGLLRLEGIRKRLARLAKVDIFHDVWIERLGWFVFLHDLGKVNTGFQARRDPNAPRVGHIAPIAGASEEIFARLSPERLMKWGEQTLLSEFFIAVLSHHGKPWVPTQDKNEVAKFWKYWERKADYDPLKEVEALRLVADAMFSGALTDGGPPLPLTNSLIHALAGLTMLADWIASSDWPNSPSGHVVESWAEGWLSRIGIDPAHWRKALSDEPVDFERAFGFAPRPAQAAFFNVEGPFAILESETGSGKTEAALWRFVERFRAGRVDGLYFALPTRTAAVQLFSRVDKLSRALWPTCPPSCVLAVPGYLDEGGEGVLPNAADGLDQVEGDARGAPVWATEHPKRYFSALISVGTIDQALLATLRVKHAHMRGAALMRHMLVVDEVHASDAYMSGVLGQLLRAHRAAGGEAALLSATLGAEARMRYLAVGEQTNLADFRPPSLTEAIDAPYPAISVPARLAGVKAGERTKTISIAVAPQIDDVGAIAATALEAARAGAKTLVVRNTVIGAIAVAEALETLAGLDAPELFRVNGVATLHHGRFAREDRRLLDREVEIVVGKNRPPGGLVLVGTQTLEQSLDIDADFLITDLAPMDVLLQRMGRLHRHIAEKDGAPRRRTQEFKEPRAIILTPVDGLFSFLSKLTKGRRRHGLGPNRTDGVPRGVYPDLLTLEATRRLCLQRPVWQIPVMNRELVEMAVHQDALIALIETLPTGERAEWKKHFNEIAGAKHADNVFANLGVLNRELSFTDEKNLFLDDEHIATRLGDQSMIVNMTEGVIGPFGEKIQRLNIPAWWRPATGATPENLVVENGSLRFEFGSLRLCYGRRGLDRA